MGAICKVVNTHSQLHGADCCFKKNIYIRKISKIRII